MDTRRLLVPVDFSRESLRAVREAEAIARRDGRCWIELLHVLQPPMAGWSAARHAAERTIARRRLEELLLSLHHHGVRKAHAELAEGNPTHEILAEARRKGSDLVVMGSHRRRGFGRFVLGSVSEAVMRRTSIPVLVAEGIPS